MTERPSLTDEQLREWRENGIAPVSAKRWVAVVTELLALRAERAKLEAALREYNATWFDAQPAESGATRRKVMPEIGLECVMLNIQCFNPKCLDRCQDTIPGPRYDRANSLPRAEP